MESTRIESLIEEVKLLKPANSSKRILDFCILMDRAECGFKNEVFLQMM